METPRFRAVVAVLTVLAVLGANDVPHGAYAAVKKVLEVPECGTVKATVEGRVNKGTNASPGELPWVVSIYYNKLKKDICTGSIITKNHVLTAAHCTITSHGINNFRVFYGSNVRNKATSKGIAKAITPSINPAHAAGTPPLLDVQILVLDGPVQFNAEARPVCLFGSDSTLPSLAGQDALFGGWGTLDDSLNMPSVLQKSWFKIVDSKSAACVKTYGTYTNSTFGICAISKPATNCKGDSGGPLVIKRDGLYYQVGSTSFGLGTLKSSCPSPGEPQVFARVSSAAKFIQDTVANNGGI